MVAVELLVGAVFLIASGSAFWFALPRDGEVRGYLRNEQVQAYYTRVVVGFIVGVVSLLLGLADMIG
jgi:hypothetical protein